MVAVTVCDPAVEGGTYTPAVEIVPTVAEPPAIPSTDHVTGLLLALNCWVVPNVTTAARGVTAKPMPVPLSETE